MVNFRKVEDKDFKQIAKLYHAYIDWQKQADPNKEANPKLTAQEMVDVYHKRKRGSQAANYKTEEAKRVDSDHFGWVAEENGEILAYYEWGGKTQPDLYDGTCACYISVWKEGYQKTAEELLAWTFGELKKEGFKVALGHMPERMLKDSKYQWIEKYSQRKVFETEGGKDLQFQRDL